MIFTAKVPNTWGNLAKLFESGYVLTGKDLRQIYQEYNYSPASVSNFKWIVGSGRFAAETGVNVDFIKYRKQIIFLNTDLPVEDTDFQDVRSFIDRS